MDLSRYPATLKDLIDKASEPVALKLGLTIEAAREAVYLVTEVIRKDWSGDNFYLPKGFAHDIQQRDREMYEKFTGANHAALAKEYNLTVRQVYERINLVSVEEFKRRQPALFE